MAGVGDFERATGVNEHLRQCMANACRKYFRAPADETLCPYCGSDHSRDTRESADVVLAKQEPEAMEP